MASSLLISVFFLSFAYRILHGTLDYVFIVTPLLRVIEATANCDAYFTALLLEIVRSVGAVSRGMSAQCIIHAKVVGNTG